MIHEYLVGYEHDEAEDMVGEKTEEEAVKRAKNWVAYERRQSVVARRPAVKIYKVVEVMHFDVGIGFPVGADV